MSNEDEVSTASGSDRVIALAISTVAYIEDPVATARGSDLIIAVNSTGWQDVLPRRCYSNQVSLIFNAKQKFRRIK